MTLIEWIETGNFQFKRINERQWGGYELAVSADAGVSWAGFPRPFGSSWKEIQAFELVLTDAVKNDIFRQQLSAWLGESRVKEIQTILGIQNNVSEHLHNEQKG